MGVLINRVLSIARWPSLADSWEGMKGFGDSAFTTPLTSRSAGAYGDQRIAERAKTRDEVTKEIPATNSALTLALTGTNTVIPG